MSAVQGACHCGAVRFSVVLSEGPGAGERCNCSFCAMRGAVAVTARRDGLTLLAGADNLTLYQFNTRAAEHYFCKTCGIYTHHRRRSNPDELGVNLACLEGQTPFLPVVPVNDGQRHATDTGVERRAGVLRFTPEDETP